MLQEENNVIADVEPCKFARFLVVSFRKIASSVVWNIPIPVKLMYPAGLRSEFGKRSKKYGADGEK